VLGRAVGDRRTRFDELATVLACQLPRRGKGAIALRRAV
jgi:hypothetical protein